MRTEMYACIIRYNLYYDNKCFFACLVFTSTLGACGRGISICGMFLFFFFFWKPKQVSVHKNHYRNLVYEFYFAE